MPGAGQVKVKSRKVKSGHVKSEQGKGKSGKVKIFLDLKFSFDPEGF